MEVEVADVVVEVEVDEEVVVEEEVEGEVIIYSILYLIKGKLY